ncbi:MAG: hypothetical protein WB624_08330 [Xanthobacteraceae bacterium]|jgi:hypothetical protein
MIAIARSLIAAFALGLLTVAAVHAESAKSHRVVIQVDQNDPAVMNLALNNAQNIVEYYRDKHEDVAVEIVAYGPGLTMLRDDTSPVKDRIAHITGAEATFPSKIVFSACNNTLQGMQKREGHKITIIPQAGIVPSGAVRIMQLEEQGWSYVRP